MLPHNGMEVIDEPKRTECASNKYDRAQVDAGLQFGFQKS